MFPTPDRCYSTCSNLPGLTMKLQLPRTAAAALLLATTAVATNNILTADKLEADIKTSE